MKVPRVKISRKGSIAVANWLIFTRCMRAPPTASWPGFRNPQEVEQQIQLIDSDMSTQDILETTQVLPNEFPKLRHDDIQ